MSTATMLTLRPYQDEALAHVDAAEARGIRRQLGVAATGLGKTVMFCALARRRGGRTLILAHRDELITQAAGKVIEVWPDARVGIVKARSNHVNMPVVVASVQTLARPERLRQLVAYGRFETVVVDEAHHAAADSYGTILEALGCNEPDGPLLLGVTATPDRGDGKALAGIFDEIVFAYDIRWGITHGYLSDIRGMRVGIAADFGTLRTRHGDFDQGQAGAMLEDAGAPELIVAAWCEHARDRRTLVFTPTVALAEQVSDEFNLRGVRAMWVSGGTPLEARRAILAAYAEGRIDVLVNCAVLTEGYDDPRTDCIVVARPTKSRALYTQMIGRGTRRHPDKTDCLVIDVVGVTEMHSLVNLPSLFGVEQPDKVWDEEATVMGALRAEAEERERHGVLRAEDRDLFNAVRAAGFAWVDVHDLGEPRRYEVGLGQQGKLVLVQLPTGSWRAGWQDGMGVKRVLADDVTLEMAQGVAEDLGRTTGSPLAAADAGWRQLRGSAKQRGMVKALGGTVPKGATRGELSDLITRLKARGR